MFFVFYFRMPIFGKTEHKQKAFRKIHFFRWGKKGQLFSQVLFQGMTGLKTSTKYLVKKKTGYYQN